MYQKFFTKTLESKFIKNLLYNTALPLYKTVRTGDYILKDHTYVYQSEIIRCTKAGYLNLNYWDKYSLKYNLSNILTKQEIRYSDFVFYSKELNESGTKLVNVKKLPIEVSLVPDKIREYLEHSFVTTDLNSITAIEKIDEVEYEALEAVDQETGEIKKRPSVKLICSINEIHYSKDKLIGTSTSVKTNAYPRNDLKNGFWYVAVDSPKRAVYDHIMTYEFGRPYPQFTEKFISEFGYYDSETHEHLGKYLRCLRDLYNIDLMPLYNCYSGRYAPNFNIKIEHMVNPNDEDDKIPVYSLKNNGDKEFKLAQVPIQFNKTYTIALDTDCEVYVAPAFIKNDRLIYVLNSKQERLNLTALLNRNIELQNGCKFKHPFTYRLDLGPDNITSEADIENIGYLEDNERNLYLLIQVPATVTTSLVVLEGDYTLSENSIKYYDMKSFENLLPEEQAKLLVSNLSLLKLSDKNSYAFSNRLIEYLTLNVVTHLDTIDNNVKRVQLEHDLQLLPNAVPGVWDDIIKAYYYKAMQDNIKIEHYDLLGYIDRDTEKYCLD